MKIVMRKVTSNHIYTYNYIYYIQIGKSDWRTKRVFCQSHDSFALVARSRKLTSLAEPKMLSCRRWAVWNHAKLGSESMVFLVSTGIKNRPSWDDSKNWDPLLNSLNMDKMLDCCHVETYHPGTVYKWIGSRSTRLGVVGCVSLKWTPFSRRSMRPPARRVATWIFDHTTLV